MAAPDFPDGLSDRHASPRQGWRRLTGLGSLIILSALMLLAMTGTLGGGRSDWQTAETSRAALAVHTPRTLRNGMFFETRVRIEARAAIAQPVLAVPATLWRDMTVNTELPDPKDQEFADGSLRFTYEALKPGEVLELKFDGQINPPLVAGTSGTIALLDGERPLASLPLMITVLP